MRNCFLGAIAAAAMTAGAVALGSAPLFGQEFPSIPPTPKSVCPDNNPVPLLACARERARTFTPPRAADGRPDLSGYWGGTQAPHENLEAHVRTPDDNGGPSFVVDPADGKVPMQAWAEARRRENRARYIDQNAQCFQSGVPRHLYMGAYQFLQTRSRLVQLSEETNAYRNIILDGRPHVGKDIVLWQGDSRGRWEGNTLVVETTNFNNPAPAAGFQGSTDALQIVERFSVVDANTLRYTYTVTDPKTWTTSWSAEAPLPRIDPPLYEFACHEQNYGLINLVMGAQIRATEGVLDPRDPRAAR